MKKRVYSDFLPFLDALRQTSCFLRAEKLQQEYEQTGAVLPFSEYRQTEDFERWMAQDIYCAYLSSEDAKNDPELKKALEEILDTTTGRKACIRKGLRRSRPLAERWQKKRRNARNRRNAASSRIDRQIVNEIPDDIIDLYPTARKLNRHFILHVGETNSGKTHDAIQAYLHAESGIYLGPLRLLACEIFDLCVEEGIPCILKTGEEEERMEGASHQSSTVELLDVDHYYDVAVIDEAQMLSDPERGCRWTRAIMGAAADEIHVCMAPHALSIVTRLIQRCGDDYEIINHDRMTPLILEKKVFHFPEDVQPGDALIVFSKRAVLHVAHELQKDGHHPSVVYGALPYTVRREEVRRFISGENDMVVATDAIGMGMNLPVRRIVFMETEKFDGHTKRPLLREEIRQVAGRAGRFGLYEEGYVSTMYYRSAIKDALLNPGDQLSQAPLGFPETLIDIPGNLSDILTRWNHLTISDSLFYKATTARELKLCRTLEQFTDEKHVIYDFITIPFNEDNDALYNTWLSAFKDYLLGIRRAFLAPVWDRNDLKSLEDAYEYCDLAFFINGKFIGDELDEAAIKEEKVQIAEAISDYLKEHELPARKCMVCKKLLTWNHPYSLCSDCHMRRQSEPSVKRYRFFRKKR